MYVRPVARCGKSDDGGNDPRTTGKARWTSREVCRLFPDEAIAEADMADQLQQQLQTRGETA